MQIHTPMPAVGFLFKDSLGISGQTGTGDWFQILGGTKQWARMANIVLGVLLSILRACLNRACDSVYS